MRIHLTATLILCLAPLFVTVAQAHAQGGAPQACQEAMETRSPQAQVDLFTRCLNSGGVSGDEKATAYKQRAIAYMHLGRHQLALDDINQAMKIKPDDSDNFYLRGFAYRALGQLKQAVEDSSRAIALEPGFAAAYANRAFAHKALGNLGQAQSDARRAKELDSGVKVPTF